MSGFFNPDNKLFSALSKLFDLVMLNTVWLLLYVPFFGLLYAYGATGFIGLFILAILTLIIFVPSMTAMYYSIVKAIRHQRSYPIKEFFRSFKQNFKQGAVISAILLVFTAVFALDLYILFNPSETANATYNSILTSAVIAVCYFVLGTVIFFCPVISRFHMTLKNAVKFSFGLSVRHVWCTILSLLLWAATVLLIYITGGVLIILAVTPAMLVESFMMEKVLKKYVMKTLEDQKASQPEKEEPGDDDEIRHDDESRDEWYVE